MSPIHYRFSKVTWLSGRSIELSFNVGCVIDSLTQLAIRAVVISGCRWAAYDVNKDSRKEQLLTPPATWAFWIPIDRPFETTQFQILCLTHPTQMGHWIQSPDAGLTVFCSDDITGPKCTRYRHSPWFWTQSCLKMCIDTRSTTHVMACTRKRLEKNSNKFQIRRHSRLSLVWFSRAYSTPAGGFTITFQVPNPLGSSRCRNRRTASWEHWDTCMVSFW